MEDGRRETNFLFEELPEDVQLNILSFLTLEGVGNFSCTSKRFSELYRDGRSRLWRFLCDRRWGHFTEISAWGQGNVSYKLLYRILHGWENLLGFWRLCGTNAQRSFVPDSHHAKPATLVFFEWGPWFIAGSWVSTVEGGTYQKGKKPFMWMWITSEGQVRRYLDPDGNLNEQPESRIPDLDLDLIPVNASLIGGTFLKVELNAEFGHGMNVGEDSGRRYSNKDSINCQSLEDTLEIFEFYANIRNSNSCRRQRKKEQGRQERRRSQTKWETEYFVKIVDCSPTLDHPLQGFRKSADAPTVWKEFTTPDGRKHYYNTFTKTIIWSMGEELKLVSKTLILWLRL